MKQYMLKLLVSGGAFAGLWYILMFFDQGQAPEIIEVLRITFLYLLFQGIIDRFWFSRKMKD